MTGRFSLLPAVSALVMLASAGCSRVTPTSNTMPVALSCPSPMRPHLRTSVHFDRANTLDPQNPYSPPEWNTFISEVLTRFLPAGGSIYENTGWWRRPNGTTQRGIGRTVVAWAPLPDSTPHRAGVDSVIAHIKRQYRHQVVFREEERVCEGAY